MDDSAARDHSNEAGLAPVLYDEYVSRLPAPWPDATLRAGVAAAIRRAGQKVVAIDDDPTGCQTVHDVPLLLEWSVEALCDGLRDPAPALFVLTNSRAMPAEQAAAVNRRLAGQLHAAGERCRQSFVVVSRSDSTLRGHFLAETEALSAELGPYDGVILAPCFFEAGRHTAEGIHWVRQGERLLPAAQTESARDASFGFSHSWLPAWVEEKTGGRVPAGATLLVRLEDVRRGGPARVAELLMSASGGQPIVWDAWDYGDLEVLLAGLLQAEAAGKRFLYRTAASFVRARAGIGPRPLLTAQELRAGRPSGRGLVAVGSHVPRSTAQLEALLAADPAAGVELRVAELLKPETRQAAIAASITQVCAGYDAGRVPVLYTSRQLAVGDGPAESLRITNLVSEALVEAVQAAMSRRPFDWLVAKGGITAHELARRALGARRARVLGQAAAGVPVWRLGPEAIRPGMTYVVFPGNVGDADTLRRVVELLR